MPSKANKTNSNAVRIVGIDPGYDRVGIAVIEKNPHSRKETVLYSSCLQTKSKDSIYMRFRKIGEEIRNVLAEYKPDALSIENLYISKNQKTAMRVSEARGIVIYEAALKDIDVYEYTPMQIKMAITGDGSSDKNRIIKMIHLLVDLSAAKRIDDEYDAIAVALTHSALQKTPK